MASIHKDARGKSPYWFCALTRANGQRTFKSTKTTDKAEAQSLCEKWQAAEEITKSPALQNTALVAEHFLEATRKAAQGQFGENDARKVLNAVLEAAGLAPLPFSTIEEFFRDRLAAHALHKSSGTAKRYGDVLEPFLTHLGEQAKHGLTSLTSRDVESFRDAQIAAGKSNVTANFAVSIIRFALNIARRKGLIPANPAEQVEKQPEDAGERMPFSAEQLRDLLAVADVEWQGMIIVGCTAGLRIGDAAKLTWANVDLSRHVLRFRPEKTSRQKNGKALEVPLLPDLENYLLALPAPSRQPNAPLFPKLIRRKITGNSGLSNTFSRLIATAGIENEPLRTKVATKAKGKGRSVFPFSFHSTRHSFVSIMANAGVPKELRMKLAGHTTNVHDKYTHVELQSQQRGEMAESFKDGWEQRKRELPQNRFSISTLRELKPANIDSLFAFAWVHELLADYDLSQTEYGFFAIDWNFDDPAIVGAFTDWLKVQRAERERLGADSPKYRKKGRGGFRDKLRWLGALRVIHHYSPDELADYADSNLKVDAPYSHLPDLYEAAKKAQTVVDAIRARKGPPPKPQWDSKALRKRVGIGDS